MKKNIYKRFFFLSLVLLVTLTVKAQRNVVPAQYYFNPYLSNAAMAGVDSGLNVMLSYNKQYDDMPGAPLVRLLSADYLVGKRVGLGLNVANQKAGLLNKTRVALSYAYHLPLSANGQTLHFGISAAVENNSLPMGEVDGDLADPSLLNYNSRGAYMDGDFGLTYTGNNITLQVAVPTIRNYVVSEVYNSIDRATLFSSASYRINFASDEINSLEPRLGYTAVKGNTDIWDFGMDFKCANNLANIQAIYHSTKSYTVGLGVNIQSYVQVLALYTSETKSLRTYTDGNLSLNLKIALFK